MAWQASNQLAGNPAVDRHRQKPGRKKNSKAFPSEKTGSLTGRLASRCSATGQTNRRHDPNLYGRALNGRSEIRSISPSSVQATADLLHSASDFRTPVQCERKKLYVRVTMKNEALLDA